MPPNRNPLRLLTILVLGASTASLPSCSPEGDSPSLGAASATLPQATANLAVAQATARLAAIEVHFRQAVVRHGSPALRAAADGWLVPDRSSIAGAPLADLSIAHSADGPTRIRDRASGLMASLRMLGTSSASRNIVAGLAVGPAAGPAASTLIQRATRAGVEDYLYFERPPSLTAIRYELELGNTAGLRLVANTLELCDSSGAPRLRAASPYLIDARGRRAAMPLKVRGCAYDTNPRPPWGRAPTKAGAARCSVELSWPRADLSYPVLVDPAWESTFNNLATARSGHTATEIAPGSPVSLVLIAGGFDNGGQALASAELYHPLSRTFGATGAMATPRGNHTATALASVPAAGLPVDVLVAGGSSSAAGGGLSSLERYRSLNGTFVAVSVAPAPAPRTRHTATLFADAQVLLAGGFGAVAGQPVATAAVYGFDGLNDSLNATSSPMQTPRARHAATRLTTTDSDVLITGGQNDSQGNADQDGELFDPMTGSFSFVATSNASAKMGNPRMDHAATMLSDGRVLITGGTNGTLYLNTVDLYLDPENFGNTTGFAFQPTPILMQHGRAGHSATLLPTGEVVIAGGRQGSLDADVIGQDEQYDPTTTSFQATGASIAVQARSEHVALLVDAGGSALAGRAVWVAGGRGLAGAVSSAELLVKPLGDACSIDAACASGHCNPEGICCNTACAQDCYSCRQSNKQDGTPDGVCGATKSGEPPFVESTCVNEVEVHRACDGAGQALPVLAVDCKPSTCNGAGTACSTGCNTDQDCSGTGWCNAGSGGGGGGGGGGGEGGGGGGQTGGAGGAGGGPSWAGSCQPKVDIGSPCDHGAQCKSDDCVDAVCCDLPCAGQCQACDNPNNVGKCSAVGTPSAHEQPHPNAGGDAPRSPCQGAGSDCSGYCDGSDVASCIYPGAESEQGTPSCTCPDSECLVGPATETHQVCDGAGSAGDDPRDCGGFRCQDSERCKTGCTTDDDCIEDNICEGSVCTKLTGPNCDGAHTVRLPAADDENCTPYRCAATACLTACASVDDCVAPAVCNSAGQCVDQLAAPTLPSCSCQLPGHPVERPLGARLGWLLALLAVARGRRREPRRARGHFRRAPRVLDRPS